MLLVAHRTPRTAQECLVLEAAGAAMFECDVQFRGAEVVVSHFLPVLGRPGWLEHDNARLRWRKGIRVQDPGFTAALRLIPPGCGVLLDPKETEPGRRRRLVDALAGLVTDPGRFRVSTDDAEDLARFRDAGFATWRTIKDPRQLRTVVGGGRLPDAGVSVRHTLLDAGRVAALHAVVDTVVAWTVNVPARARELRRIGVDGVTTDSRDVLALLAAG